MSDSESSSDVTDVTVKNVGLAKFQYRGRGGGAGGGVAGAARDGSDEENEIVNVKSGGSGKAKKAKNSSGSVVVVDVDDDGIVDDTSTSGDSDAVRISGGSKIASASCGSRGSSVWGYFDPVVLNSAVVAGICKSCKKQYAAKAGCTSGLRSHLGKCDPNQWQKVVNEQQTRLTASQQKDEMSAQNMDKWLCETGAKRAEK